MGRELNIYAPGAEDFDSEGLGVLRPLDWEWEGEDNGKSVLTITHPYDDEGRYKWIAEDCIIKADIPVRTVPELASGALITSAEEWTVKTTATKAQRYMYSKASGGKKKKCLPGGTVVAVVAKGTSRYKIVTSRYGKGWIDTAGLNVKIKDVDYSTPAAVEAATPSVKTRPQLFRIHPGGIKRREREIVVEAWHISYDLEGNATDVVFNGAFTAQQMIGAIQNNCQFAHDFQLATNIGDSRSFCEMRNINPIAALLGDDEDSFVSRFGGQIVRDDYEITMLASAGLDRGFTAAYGRNLTGVKSYESDGNITTAIIPVGENTDGSPLYLENQRWVAAPNYAQYATPHCTELKVSDAKVGGKGKKKVTVALARQRMQEAVQEEWDKGVHIPGIKLEVEFALLGDSEEYKAFKDLDTCFLYDTITVWHPKACGSVAMEICGQVWNGMQQRFTRCTLGTMGGSVSTLHITGSQIRGYISGAALKPGTVGASQLEADAITANHIQANSVNADAINANTLTAETAVVKQLNAQAITAMEANIKKITTDELQAAVAQIGRAEIDEANIGNANIDHAAIGALLADLAEMITAHIQDADIENAAIDSADIEYLQTTLAKIQRGEIDVGEIGRALIGMASIQNLEVQLAAIATANIESAGIRQGTIEYGDIANLMSLVAEIADLRADHETVGELYANQLRAAVADIVSIQAQTGDFDFATAQRLVSSALIMEQGLAGSVTIENLVATEAMFMSATVGKLVVRCTAAGSEDYGKYFEIVISADGTISTVPADTPTADEIAAGETAGGRRIIESQAIISELSSTNIKTQGLFAQEIMVNALTANAITANEAFVASLAAPELYAAGIRALEQALDLTANESINLIVTSAIDDMKSDGRNLARRTGRTTREYKSTQDHIGGVGGQTTPFGKALLADESNELFTVSFDWEIINADTAVDAYLWFMDSTYGDAAWATRTGFPFPIAVGNSSGRFTQTFTPTTNQRRLGHIWAFTQLGSRTENRDMSIQVSNFKFELGAEPTEWSAAPEDAEEEMGILRSRLSQTQTGLEEIVTHITQDVDGTIGKVNAYMEFDGSDANNPKLIIGTTSSPMRMELTNSRLSFLWNGNPVAYFSDNKLFVTNVEATEQLSIGTDANGHLDIVTTELGVGFIWRA